MTVADVFHAIADENRRNILLLLQDGSEWAVTEIVVRTGERQPAVSKHLAVLRKTGIVSVHKRGRHRMYRLEAARLREVQEWLRGFEKFWNNQIDRIKDRAEAAALDRAEATAAFSRTEAPVENEVRENAEQKNEGLQNEGLQIEAQQMEVEGKGNDCEG